MGGGGDARVDPASGAEFVRSHHVKIHRHRYGQKKGDKRLGIDVFGNNEKIHIASRCRNTGRKRPEQVDCLYLEAF